VRAAAFAEPIRCSRRSLSLVPRESEPKLHRLDSAATGANTAHPTAQSAARVVRDQCRNAHRSPTEAHLDARGQPGAPSLASTPSSPSFRDWYKCGSRTRDTRFNRPLLYPSELTCGGLKQSVRAVRACATQTRGTSAPGGLENPLSLHVRCFDLVTRPRHSAVSNPPSRSRHDFCPPKTTRPRSAVPSGVSWRDCSGDCHLVSPATHANFGLTHHDFQRARGCTAGIHEIPCADFQRRAPPRVKGY
jgi:hypothetical protein